MSNKKFLHPTTIITIIAIGFASLRAQGQENNFIQLPTKPRQEDIVSIDLASEIALITAKKEFGEGVIGEPIVGYDLNGYVRAYIVPYRIGGTVFPSETEIIKTLVETRQLLPSAKKELAEIRETSLELKRDEIKFEKKGKKMCLRKNTEWEKAEEIVKNIEMRCWGTGEYATIIVSARKDLLPVPAFSNTLPYYYTYRYLAESMAEDNLGCVVSLSRFYYGGSLDQIFEFESSSNDKIWIVLFPPRIMIPGEITPRPREITEDKKDLIKDMWRKVLQEVGNEK